MVGVTTATIIILLSGGGDVEHFLTSTKKNIKHHVEDKGRQKIILSETNALSKDLKKLGKEIEGHFKEMTRVHADFNSSEAEFDAVTARLADDQEKTAKLILDAREAMKKQIARKEWEAIFKVAKD